MYEVILWCLAAAVGEVDLASQSVGPSSGPIVSPDAMTSNTDTPEILVKGKRRDVVQKIDRRVYNVPSDVKSASSDGYALLRGLPAVTIGLDVCTAETAATCKKQ